MTQQNELPTAVLDDTGLAVVAGWLTIHSIEPVQREYQQSIPEYLHERVGLPAFCYADKPPVPDKGTAIVRSADGTAWEMVADYRGQTLYNTETGEPETVTTLGPLVGLTLLPPSTPYDSWNGKQWITDKTAERDAYMIVAQADLTKLQRMATDKIAMLQDAVDLDMATEQELADLKAWKTYRVLLGRVDLSTAPDINWPTAP
jgi:hypothetical protein